MGRLQLMTAGLDLTIGPIEDDHLRETLNTIEAAFRTNGGLWIDTSTGRGAGSRLHWLPASADVRAEFDGEMTPAALDLGALLSTRGKALEALEE